MQKQKGFISIIAAFVILTIGFVGLYEYGKELKQTAEQTFGGSLVATRYGGTGTSTNAWSGLLRVATGTWATTTLTDADVPDDITLTNLPNEVSFASSSIDNLTAGTSTFLAIPILPAATPTTNYQAASKIYVDQGSPASSILTAYTRTAETTKVYPSFVYPASSTAALETLATSTFFGRFYPPKAGTVKNLWVILQNTLSGGTYTCTTTKNGIDTALATTVASNSATSTNSTNSFTMSAGEYIGARCQGSAAITSNFGFLSVELK